jgi:hypothetical protein
MQEQFYAGSASPEEKAQAKRDYDVAYSAFRRIEDILNKKLKNLRGMNDYDNPNWALRMADSNGYNRALTEVLNLIKD